MLKEEEEISIDDIHRALSHSDRRHFLHDLHKKEGPIDITDLDIENVADNNLQVRVKFRHLHLPLLEEYDLITWDKDTGKVAKGKHFDGLKHWLSAEAQVPPRRK